MLPSPSDSWCLSPEVFRYAHVVEKLWGREAWLENNPKYCAKVLLLQRGFQSSLHFHSYKDETFLVLAGEIILEIGSPEGPGYLGFGSVHQRYMKAGDKQRLFPKVPHRFRAETETALILEISTTHDDLDVTRIEESKNVSPARHDSGTPKAP